MLANRARSPILEVKTPILGEPFRAISFSDSIIICVTLSVATAESDIPYSPAKEKGKDLDHKTFLSLKKLFFPPALRDIIFLPRPRRQIR